MKKLFSFTFLLLSISTYSLEKVVPGRILPQPIILLFEEIDLSVFSKSDQKMFIRDTKFINQNLKKLKSKNSLFYIKYTFLKSLLSNPPEMFKVNRKEVIDEITAKQYSKKTSLFLKWIFQSFQNDLKEIKKSQHYDDIFNKDKNTKFLNKERKKLNLIYSWVIFSTSDIDHQSHFNSIFYSFYTSLAKSLHLHRLVSPNAKELNEVNFFSIMHSEAKKRAIETILSDQEIKKISTKPTASPKKRRVKTDDSVNPNIPNIIYKDDPSYTPPKSLPIPVDDWIFNQ